MGGAGCPPEQRHFELLKTFRATGEQPLRVMRQHVQRGGVAVVTDPKSLLVRGALVLAGPTLGKMEVMKSSKFKSLQTQLRNTNLQFLHSFQKCHQAGQIYAALLCATKYRLVVLTLKDGCAFGH